MEKNLEKPIIVEGDHDVAALRSIGFKGEIIKLNDGNRIDDFCMKISSMYREVILLTDFDRKGKALKERLEITLLYDGCLVDTYLWRSITAFNLKSVEDMPYFYSTLKENLEGKSRKNNQNQK